MPARLAVVDADFCAVPNMKSFLSGDVRGLEEYAPEALALPLESALSLAERKLDGSLDLPNLKLAIVVLTSLDAENFPTQDRDLLWSAFGLPLFEQLRGWDGRVMARECEVHDGLHFDANAIVAEVRHEELVVEGRSASLRAEITTGQCDCGLETPRLRRFSRTRTRAAAA